MLSRKITSAFENWRSSSKKALLVTGARQVGKSYAIREFGKANYEVYYEANLLLDSNARTTLTQATSAIDFINRVALLSPSPLIEGKTLIFIDEIQEYPEMVTLIKALVEDGRFSYAFSGSMLGTEFKGITSFPVGYVEWHVMRPMDFEEFCWAIGVQDSFIESIRESLRSEASVDGFLHETMLRNYRAYLVTGGMPEVVQSYIDTEFALTSVRTIQAELVSQYALDISKYAGNRAFEVREIFDQIPVQLEGESRRFAVSSLGEGARFSSYDQDFLWLVNAGVGLRVLQASEAKSPLKRTESNSMFKLYQSDTGMLLSRYPQSTARAVYLDQRRANLGGIYENVVAQELSAQKIPLWYYSSGGVGEIDFLMEGKHGHVIPIEVKSGVKARSHAALDRLISINDYKIQTAIVLSRNNVFREGVVLYLPLYMTFCLDELTEKEGGDFKIAPAII